MRPAVRAALVAFLLLFPAVGALADIPPVGWEWPWERDKRIRERDEERLNMMLEGDRPPPSLIIVPGRATRTTTLTLPGRIVWSRGASLAPVNDGGTGLAAARTIVAGVALSAALVAGGLWLARGRNRRALAGVACVLGAVVVVGLSCGPGHEDVIRKDEKRYLPELDPPTVQADGSSAGRCRLERGVVDDVVLTINAEALARLAKEPDPSVQVLPPRQGPGLPIVISVDDRATEARLIVPKKHLATVAAVLSDDDAPRADVRPVRWPVAGVPLAAALALGGLWLTGLRPRLGARGMAVLLGVVVLDVVGAVAWAKAPPPVLPPMPPLKSKLTIETADDGDAIKLVLPRAMLKDLPH